MEFHQGEQGSGGGHEWNADDIIEEAQKMAKLKQTIHQKAKINIDNKREKDKKYYDQKHADPQVCNEW